MSIVTVQDESVTWGDLQLHGPLPVDATYEIKTMSDGTNFGNPVSIIEQVQSMAIDGALAARTGWDARSIPVRLRIGANDGETLSQVEQALTAQMLLDRPPPLEWIPPLGSSAPAVFDVLVADLQRDVDSGWDFDEKYTGHRYFTLTLTCLPFARAMDTVVVPALAPPPDPGAPPVVTVIDDCSSVTHWSRLNSQTIYAAGPTVWGTITPMIRINGGIYTGTDYVHAVRTVATTTPGGLPYLVIDIRSIEGLGPGATVPGQYAVNFDSGPLENPILVEAGAGINGTDRIYVTAPASFTTLRLRKNYDDTWVAPHDEARYITLDVARVAATDTIGDLVESTTRQQSRLTTIYGAMPTRATLRLYDATPAALGTDVLVYTSSNTAWTPPLRKWLETSGPITGDASRVSGAHHALGVASVYRFPARLLETGAYSLAALISCTTAGQLTWQARMVASSDGADTLGSDQIQTGQVTIPVTTGYQVLDLADDLMLPPFEVETDDYAVELTVTGTANMTLDEAWLFCLDNGALTLLGDSGDPETGLQWIEIRSPDLGAARPSVFGGVGTVGELSACVDAKAKAFGPHRFEPGPLLVFTMCASSLVAQCELEYFPRFHSHPAANQSDPDTSGD